jgi:hypothetical protein
MHRDMHGKEAEISLSTSDNDGTPKPATARRSPPPKANPTRISSPSFKMKFAHGAVAEIFDKLRSLPESSQKRTLLGEAHACQRSIDHWEVEAPTTEEHKATMKRILTLHAATDALRGST